MISLYSNQLLNRFRISWKTKNILKMKSIIRRKLIVLRYLRILKIQIMLIRNLKDKIYIKQPTRVIMPIFFITLLSTLINQILGKYKPLKNFNTPLCNLRDTIQENRIVNLMSNLRHSLLTITILKLIVILFCLFHFILFYIISKFTLYFIKYNVHSSV